MTADECLGLGDDELRIGTEASVERADDRVARVEIQIHDRRQVEVDARVSQGPGHLDGGGPGELDVRAGTQVSRADRRRESAIRTETRNAPSLLVDGDDEATIAGGIVQRCGELAQLGRRDDIPDASAGRHVHVKEQDAAQGQVADVGQRGRCLLGRRAPESDEQHPGDLVAQAQSRG